MAGNAAVKMRRMIYGSKWKTILAAVVRRQYRIIQTDYSDYSQIIQTDNTDSIDR